MSSAELSPSKSLRLTLEGDKLQVMQLAPRFMRICGPLRDWLLDQHADRTYLHLFGGAAFYMGFALSGKESVVIREKFGPLGLRIESPAPSDPSLKPSALQAGAAAGDASAPVSALAAGVEVLGVTP